MSRTVCPSAFILRAVAMWPGSEILRYRPDLVSLSRDAWRFRAVHPSTCRVRPIVCDGGCCRSPTTGGLRQAQAVINGPEGGTDIAPETLQRLVEVLDGQAPMAADLAGRNLPGASLIRPPTLGAADVSDEFVQECHGGFLKHSVFLGSCGDLLEAYVLWRSLANRLDDGLGL